MRAAPLLPCTDAQFAGARARLAADVDTPPEPIGGMRAVQERVRIPNEGPRIATPEGRFAAQTAAKGTAARRAIHASPFVPGRHGGQPTDVVVDFQLDVRGPGTTRVVRGASVGRWP